MAQTVAGDRVGENRLLNRELSSLDFYARVLDLASDPNVPLLERVRFSSIFSLHMDEFFMVRVGGLRGLEDAGVNTRSADGRTPSQTLAEATVSSPPLMIQYATNPRVPLTIGTNPWFAQPAKSPAKLSPTTSGRGACHLPPDGRRQSAGRAGGNVPGCARRLLSGELVVFVS